jgi:hypothetical protein
MVRIIVALIAASSAWSAFAGDGPTTALPEPGTFELLALGGIVAAVVAIRNRRK